jgi:hypothetical protein
LDGPPSARRLGELAQAEPVRAGALDQLGGGGDDRSFGQAGAGSGLPFLLNIWTRGPTSRCAGTTEPSRVTLKFATIIAVVIALAIGFDAGHFIWP